MPAVGAPIGNQNSAKGRRWAHAIERAMDAYPDKPPSLDVNKGIDAAAFAFVSKMMTSSDLGFFKECGDRLDGKPAQAIIGGNEDDPPIQAKVTVEYIGASPASEKA